MTQDLRKFVIPTVGLLTCLVFAPLAGAIDIVTRKSDNVALRGQLTRMDTNSVVIKRTNGEEITVSVADLKSVQFEGEPGSLNQARSNERSGALDSALAKLIDAQKNFSVKNRNARPDLEFLIARVKAKIALTDPSRTDDAINALDSFRSANKASFRYLEATLLQASLLGSTNKASEGQALLAEVQSSTVPGFQLQAGVDLGRLLLTSGDATAALKSFEEVITRSQGKPDASAALYSGMLGKALCLQKQGQTDQAINTLDEVIQKAAETETATLAEAWIRKGDCFRQKKQNKEALMAYLHVDVLYSGEPVQHAEALMRLTELWGPNGHEDRAMEASARLTERYPNSPFTKKGATGG